MKLQKGNNRFVEKSDRMLYGYMRVSTQVSETRDRNQTFDRQEMILKENGVEMENVFQDRISGGIFTKERPEFERMMSVIKKGDKIIVSEMSRFSRSLQDLIEAVNELIKKGVGIKFVKENIDLDDNGFNPMNKLMFQMFGAFAEFEKSIIAERVKQGLQAKKEQGVKLGRPSKYSEEQIAEIRAMYDLGCQYKEITERCNISKPSIIKMAKENGWQPRNSRKENEQND